MKRTPEYIANLVHELRQLPTETGWCEFKVNMYDPQEIGEYISALANSAVLAGKQFAYLVWGISNESHAIVGTTFRPRKKKVGNEEIENWLTRLLVPQVHFQFYQISLQELPIVVLEIKRASLQPVRFNGQRYIRVGSYKKKLKDVPAKERALWRQLGRIPFEEDVALERVSEERVLESIDYPAYFELLGRRLTPSPRGIVNALASDRLIVRSDAGGWNITNLGLILFARRLRRHPKLHRKAPRVIQYKGRSRIETIREQVGGKGYASGFSGLIQFINALLPSNEVIGEALRTAVRTYPELALRELVANALIHQDFSVGGAGPTVEIFENRIEITNPGKPLVETERFVDSPPRSRNEGLAAFMRRIGICEERGSGWDKVVWQSEVYQLPPPLAEVVEGNTRVVLFAPRSLSNMDRAERVRAMYLHACLRYVKGEYLVNASVRERFKIEIRNSARASRLISEAIEKGAIVADDPAAAPKLMRYAPWWAKEASQKGT